MTDTTDKKVWFITGAGRGMGVDFVKAALAAGHRFGRIDVLVNNAGSFFAGYFEELTAQQFERQFGTLLIGPMNVTRAVLPVMRKQRSGHIISISQKVADLQPQIDAYRDLSTSLALDELESTGSTR